MATPVKTTTRSSKVKSTRSTSQKGDESSKVRREGESISDAPVSATRRRTRASSISSNEEHEELPPPKRTPSKRTKGNKTVSDEVVHVPETIDEEEPPASKVKSRAKKTKAIVKDDLETSEEQPVKKRVKKSTKASIDDIPVSVTEPLTEPLEEKPKDQSNVLKVVPGTVVEAVPVNCVEPVKNHVDKGRNVSGRGWKRTNQKRASTFMRNDQLSGKSQSWEMREALKHRRAELKLIEAQMKEEQRAEKAEARKVREERAAMRAANEMRNTVIQTISKTHKLKTMNKKQLRQIKKTAINSKTGAMELISPWQK